MRILSISMVAALVCALAAWGAETGSVEQAPVEQLALKLPAQEAAVPETPEQIMLTFDQYFAEKERSIQEEISADLIDLDELRQAIQAKVSQQVMRMNLQECIQIALKQNPDIIVAQLQPLKTDGDIKAAKGEFDPVWRTTANYMRSSMTTSQQFTFFGQGISSVEMWQTTIESALVGKLKTGTQYSAAFNLEKEESTYGSFIEDFSTRATLSLTQPLLKGVSWKANTVRIKAAKNLRNVTEAQLRLQIMNTLAEVIKAYWDLVGTVEALKVREESLANAERLLKMNETRREIGTAADIEVLQAKAGVATRQSELITARSQISAAADLLKKLLDLREGDLFSKAQIVPTDRPNIEDKSFMDPADFQKHLDESVTAAVQNRPEITIAELQITNAKLDEFRAKNEMMPEVNITGSYMQGGRNHYLERSLYGIRDKQDYAYSYGLQATVPLGNRAARGAHLRAKLTRRETEERKKQAEQTIMMGVHMAMNNVMTNQILVESNRQAVRLQEANVVAEEKRLRLGVTTSWQTLRVQEDLTAAQTMLLQAQIAYEKAMIDLQLAEGTLLGKLNIEFEAPDRAQPVNYFYSILPKKPW
ncbi:MAG TPA: TolC family protein [Candidatus Hydrogenedentes bacterium]|nr:TolC family protein [Candidatus Hydrogenedentota bacterium]